MATGGTGSPLSREAGCNSIYRASRAHRSTRAEHQTPGFPHGKVRAVRKGNAVTCRAGGSSAKRGAGKLGQEIR